MKFEEKLQKLRKASGFSQEVLADKLGVSRQAVSKWESGASYPEMDKLIQMSKLFECTLDELVNENDTDKTIINNNVSKKMYLDSFMEFITKSVNLFSSMKFSSLVKSIIELGIMALILLCIGVVVYLFGELLLDEVVFIFNTGNDVLWNILTVIDNLLSTVLLFIIIAILFVVYIQIYKIRYLDYYDKLVYESNQSKKIEDSNEYLDNDNKKKIKELEKDKKSERIIIRDQEHLPFAFLSPIVSFILGIFKLFMVLVSFIFIVSLIFFIVGLVLSIYLISFNNIFIGVLLGLVGLIIFNIILLEVLYKFIVKLSINKKRVFIVMLLSIIISSIGLGISLINLKDFDIYFNHGKDVQELVSFDDTLDIIDTNNFYNINLIVSDTLGDDLLIEYHLDDELVDYSVIKEDNVIKINIEEKYSSFGDYVHFALDNLKDDKYKVDYYTGYPLVIKGSKENILSIVKYYRDNKGVIYIDYNNDGYFYN